MLIYFLIQSRIKSFMSPVAYNNSENEFINNWCHVTYFNFSGHCMTVCLINNLYFEWFECGGVFVSVLFVCMLASDFLELFYLH